MLQRAVICNRTLHSTKQIIQNHCLFLKVNKALQKIFSIKLLLAFGKNKCLKQLIGGNVIQNYKSIKKKKPNKYEECTPCTPGIRSLPCLQVQNKHLFCSQQNERMFMIFHQVNCKNDFLSIFQKCHIQYGGKAETDFKLKLNNHFKDVYKADTISALPHKRPYLYQRDQFQ